MKYTQEHKTWGYHRLHMLSILFPAGETSDSLATDCRPPCFLRIQDIWLFIFVLSSIKRKAVIIPLGFTSHYHDSLIDVLCRRQILKPIFHFWCCLFCVLRFRNERRLCFNCYYLLFKECGQRQRVLSVLVNNTTCNRKKILFVLHWSSLKRIVGFTWLELFYVDS